MNSDVLYTHWSHNTYLLAIVTVENVLELYRVGERTQKVFQVESDKPITSVAFNPNCTPFSLLSPSTSVWHQVRRHQTTESLKRRGLAFSQRPLTLVNNQPELHIVRFVPHLQSPPIQTVPSTVKTNPTDHPTQELQQVPLSHMIDRP